MRVTVLGGSGNAVIRGLLVAAFSVLATRAAAFESQTWPGILPSASATIYVQSADLVEGSPAAVGGWVVIDYKMSVDCSPPRACYAASQRVYLYAYCSIGVIRELQRISLDLNGNVLAETGERVAYIPPRGSVDGAAARTLCEASGFYYRRPWRGRDGYLDTDD